MSSWGDNELFRVWLKRRTRPTLDQSNLLRCRLAEPYCKFIHACSSNAGLSFPWLRHRFFLVLLIVILQGNTWLTPAIKRSAGEVLTLLPFSVHARCMKALKRKSASIPNSRWLTYATAGAASALACGHPDSAEATIHYSGPINQWIGESNHREFPLDQRGDSIRLRHDQVFSEQGYGGTAWFGIAGLAGAAFAGFYHPCTVFPFFVSNLKRGQVISNQQFLARPAAGLLYGSRSIACSSYHGQFNGAPGYVGFKFNNGHGDQYGWARLAIRGHDHAIALIDYAYGDVGDTIGAGQRSGHDLPELESLAGLAVGAVGLLAWRRKRSPAAR